MSAGPLHPCHKECAMLRWSLFALGIAAVLGAGLPAPAAAEAKPARMLFVLGPPPSVPAGGGLFTTVAEGYKHACAEVDRHVLARCRGRPPARDQNANMDIVWTREVGKGRVFYCALGHGKDAWENPAWQKLIVQ